MYLRYKICLFTDGKLSWKLAFFFASHIVHVRVANLLPAMNSPKYVFGARCFAFAVSVMKSDSEVLASTSFLESVASVNVCTVFSFPKLAASVKLFLQSCPRSFLF